jgi:putative peptidoglycan lipid II flippase
MRYATTLYQFPQGLVVTALSVAILPTLSEQAHGSLATFKRTLAQGIRLVLALILPATAGLFALAPAIVALIFQHGEFSGAATEVTGLILRLFLFGLPFAAVDQMLIFASYARKDTLRPALVGVVSIGVYVFVAATLPELVEATGLENEIASLLPLVGHVQVPNLEQPVGLYSLMIADGVKHLVHTLLMLWVLQRQVGGLAGQGIISAAARSLLAALATGLTAFLVASALSPILTGSTLGTRLALVAAGGGAGLLIYLAAVALLDITEAKSLGRLFRRRSR